MQFVCSEKERGIDDKIKKQTVKTNGNIAFLLFCCLIAKYDIKEAIYTQTITQQREIEIEIEINYK